MAILGTLLGTDLGGPSGAGPVDPILPLAPFAWFRADTYVAAATKVASFTDRMNAANSVAQPTDANRVLLPVVDAVLNGQMSCAFSPTLFSYDSNLAPVNWKFMHDGTGMEIVSVLNVTTPGTQLMLGTRGAVPANHPGFTQFLVNTPSNPGMSATNDGGVVIIGNPVGTAVLSGGCYLDTFWKDGIANPEWGIYANQILTTSGAGTPGTMANPPTHTFRVGIGGTFRWAESIVFNRILTPAERTIVRNYMTVRYALT